MNNKLCYENSKDCDKFSYEIDGKKYCTYSCPENMVTDQFLKKCHADITGCEIAASDDERYCLDLCDASNREVVVSKKCTACMDYYSEHQKTCNKTCSEYQLTDKEKKMCYPNKYFCLDFISADGTECVRKCDSQKKEYPVNAFLRGHPPKCRTCEDYFTDGKDKGNNSCKIKCNDHEITIIPLKTCTMEVADCNGYTLSEDKKSCS